MMTHLTEETLLAVRDREQVADEVLAHVDECASCARALEEARSRAEAVERALAVLAQPVRAVDEGPRAADVAAGRGRRDVAAGTGARVTPIGRGRRDVTTGTGTRVVPIGRGRRDAAKGIRVRGGARTLWWLGRAAVLVLIGAGALSALPGPFNGWIPRMFSGAPSPGAPLATAPELPEQVGGRMAVASGPVVVRLETVPPGTVIDVRQVTSQAVGVLAGTGSEFSYGGGEVRASIVAGPVTVELPEGVVPVTLIVNGGVYLVVDAAGTEVPGPRTAAGGENLVTFRVPN